jgi:tRNA-splicing ligase RtcB
MASQHLNPKLISWASILDPQTEQQAHTTSKMPFIFPHLALMPDAHLGKGATVGSVIPTEGAIMPAAVGVDIGCGMMAIRTQFTQADIRDQQGIGNHLSYLREDIEFRIPLSAGRNNERYYDARTEDAVNALGALADFEPKQYAPNWDLQFGSLGSGNHFIEVSLDEDDRVWLFLHSGSRGIGNKIANHHIRIALDYCRRHFISLPDPDLAYLVAGTREFSAYLGEMHWAQRFAFENRAEMMRRVVDAFEEWIGASVESELEVNCHHNYTTQEEHFGRTVWLSRKGAIDAHEGVWGLIPGSMGTRSYVVQGKGNKVALCSAPHGAGRVHSRSSAKRNFTADQLREAMAGIEYRDTDAFIDEIPQAYKDIDTVMRDAADLVEVRHELRQIINVKGD